MSYCNKTINRTNVMEERWDYLVILDACRYDYFEKVWSKYLSGGRLSRINTVGTATVEWRDNSFTQYYDDVVYVSANPYINSVKAVKGFSAMDHFPKVYDVWESGWEPELGTVRPETVTKAAIDAAANHPDKRMIIHYLQPHSPYLSLADDRCGFPLPDMDTGRVLAGTDLGGAGSRSQRTWLKRLMPLFKNNRILGDHPEWLLRGFLGMAAKSPMDAVRRKYGDKGLRQAYMANLEIVLEQVAVLLGHLSGRIVVSSDHGEQLGENRCYTHTPGSKNPYLLDVPWLVIEKEKRPGEDRSATAESKPAEENAAPDDDAGAEDKSKIEEKLRSLGYFD